MPAKPRRRSARAWPRGPGRGSRRRPRSPPRRARASSLDGDVLRRDDDGHTRADLGAERAYAARISLAANKADDSLPAGRPLVPAVREEELLGSQPVQRSTSLDRVAARLDQRALGGAASRSRWPSRDDVVAEALRERAAPPRPRPRSSRGRSPGPIGGGERPGPERPATRLDDAGEQVRASRRGGRPRAGSPGGSRRRRSGRQSAVTSMSGRPARPTRARRSARATAPPAAGPGRHRPRTTSRAVLLPRHRGRGPGRRRRLREAAAVLDHALRVVVGQEAEVQRAVRPFADAAEPGREGDAVRLRGACRVEQRRVMRRR